MKIDIIFKLAYLCFLIGSIKAVEIAEVTDDKSNTTVPSVANNSTEDLNNTSTNSTINKEDVSSTIETSSSVPTPEPIPSITPPTPTPTPTPPPPPPSSNNTTNATENQTSEKTDSTEPINPSTTELSTGEHNPTAASSKASSGGFNALSFIGGIVFTVGILAIMYVGFKFYKSRTERNYHTL